MIRRRLKCNNCGSKFILESYVPRVLKEELHCIKCRKSKREGQAERLLEAIFREHESELFNR